MARRLAVLASALLCACTGRTTADHRWIGPLTSASPATCPPTRGSAILRNGAVTFAPDEGTWVLTGTATADGTLEADKDKQSATNKGTDYQTHLQGRWTEAELSGTYTTPKCSYTVALKRY